VSYLDIKPRYFDLKDGNEELQVELESVYAFSPSFTMKFEVIGTRNNRTGNWESGIQELKLRPLYLHPIKPFGIKAKFGVGLEWFKDLGKTRDGTGKGTDELAPLVGIGWIPTDKDFIVTLVQYFHSYDENETSRRRSNCSSAQWSLIGSDCLVRRSWATPSWILTPTIGALVSGYAYCISWMLPLLRELKPHHLASGSPYDSSWLIVLKNYFRTVCHAATLGVSEVLSSWRLRVSSPNDPTPTLLMIDLAAVNPGLPACCSREI
jgi:hypothetical protein